MNIVKSINLMEKIKVSVVSVVKNCDFCIAMFKDYEIKYALKYHDQFHLSHQKLEAGKIKVKTFQGHCNRIVNEIRADMMSERYKKHIKENGDALNNIKVVAIDPFKKK